MKEAIGTSMVFNLMMIFVGVLIVILISSISFSKAFKIRNRIIDRLEENNGYNTASVELINNDLRAIGYQVVPDVKCASKTYNWNGEEVDALVSDLSDTYQYCVYQYNTDRGSYYGVTVFIRFDIPLIGDYVKIPVYGESRIIYDKGMVKN